MQAAAEYQIETDRRRYERVDVALFGRCLLEARMEIPCQAINISPGDVAMTIAHSPRLNEHVIVYLDHVGRIEGNACRLFEGGFAMQIHATPRKRERLNARIEWLKAHNTFNLEDVREQARIVPRESKTALKLSDGRSYPIEIIDISLSGAAVSIEVKPAIGSKVSLAGMEGTVIRHFPEGIAIEFAIQPSQDGFSRRFA